MASSSKKLKRRSECDCLAIASRLPIAQYWNSSRKWRKRIADERKDDGNPRVVETSDVIIEASGSRSSWRCDSNIACYWALLNRANPKTKVSWGDAGDPSHRPDWAPKTQHNQSAAQTKGVTELGQHYKIGSSPALKTYRVWRDLRSAYLGAAISSKS